MTSRKCTRCDSARLHVNEHNEATCLDCGLVMPAPY